MLSGLPVDPVALLTFVPAALALNLTPGADMMFCLGQGLRRGARPAAAAAAGISAGGMIHCLLAGLGLSAVISALPLAFDVIRWVGVAYLLWLAWQSLRSGRGPLAAASGTGRAFTDGVMVNLSNPKVILFTLAFVPQFVDPERGQILAQFLIFGAVLGIGGFIANGTVGYFAAGLGRRLTGSAGFSRVLGYISAGVFGVLALRLAAMERS